MGDRQVRDGRKVQEGRKVRERSIQGRRVNDQRKFRDGDGGGDGEGRRPLAPVFIDGDPPRQQEPPSYRADSYANDLERKLSKQPGRWAIIDSGVAHESKDYRDLRNLQYRIRQRYAPFCDPVFEVVSRKAPDGTFSFFARRVLEDQEEGPSFGWIGDSDESYGDEGVDPPLTAEELAERERLRASVERDLRRGVGGPRWDLLR